MAREPKLAVRVRHQAAAKPRAMMLALCLAAMPVQAVQADGTAPPMRNVFHGPAQVAGSAARPALRATTEVVMHGESVAGIISRPQSAQGAPTRHPAVLLVHDSQGFDDRSEAYVRQLLGASLVVLQVELRSLSADGADPEESELDRLRHSLAAVAADSRVDPDRIGAIGFGEGARALLLADGLGTLSARVLLYPGCGTLASSLGTTNRMPATRPAPVLIMHGMADSANSTEDCARLAGLLAGTASEVSVIAWPDASYGWDIPLPEGSGIARVPAPGGEGYVAVDTWPELTALSATRVAAYFAAAFRRSGE